MAQIPHAANLYKQSGFSWSIYGITIFDLCISAIRKNKVDASEIKDFLEEHTQ